MLNSGKRYYSRNWKLSGLLLSLLIPCSRRKSNAFVHTATFLSAKREIPRGLGDTEWRKRGKDAAEVVNQENFSMERNKETNSTCVYTIVRKYPNISVDS